jgi:diguanylate cyclase (GGDEF)-like protein
MARRPRWLLGGLVVAAFAFPAIPVGSPAQAVYHSGFAVVTVVLAALGIRRNHPSRLRFWGTLVTGMAFLAAGDTAWYVLRLVWHTGPTQMPDLLRLVGYVLLATAVVFLVVGRNQVRDVAGMIDALIVVTGTGVLAAIFAVEPAIARADGALLAPVVATAYPLAQLLMTFALARVWRTRDYGLVAYRAFGSATLTALVAATGYAFLKLSGSDAPITSWLDVGYLLAYAGFAVGARHPSMRELSVPVPERATRQSHTLLVILSGASMLAPTLLIVEGMRGHALHWQIVGPGSIVLFALVLARVAGLLRQVQRQARQLEVLARDDWLTGLPNRRTWDHELGRACVLAAEHAEPLTVALLDLDHFKKFNDESGHAAGDRLLREATVRWRSQLPSDAFLARYGGEEFTVLFRGRSLDEAYAQVVPLLAVTPMEQTFSAGLAAWDGAEDPAALVARADAELYAAKRDGRARIHRART